MECDHGAGIETVIDIHANDVVRHGSRDRTWRRISGQAIGQGAGRRRRAESG
jgi:hypothetical protein